MDGPHDGQVLSLLSEIGDMFGDHDSRRGRRDRLEFAPYFTGGQWFWIPGFVMAHATPAVENNTGFCFANGAGGRVCRHGLLAQFKKLG